jgi:hypothetical protein
MAVFWVVAPCNPVEVTDVSGAIAASIMREVVAEVDKKLPALYETQRIIIVFTNYCDRYLSSGSSIKSKPTYLRSILILSYYVPLSFPS